VTQNKDISSGSPRPRRGRPLSAKGAIQVLKDNIELVLDELFPDNEGFDDEGECWVLNPTRDDQTTGSFSIHRSGAFHDFADPEFSGGNLLELIQKLEGVDEGTALERARDLISEHGLTKRKRERVNGSRRKKPVKAKPPAPEPEPVEPESMPVLPPDFDPDGNPVTATYEYRNPVGEIVFYTLRVEPEPGQKAVKPVTWQASRNAWSWKYPAGLRPLYQSDLITPGEPIAFAEGEKTADHLTATGITAVTSSGGSSRLMESDLEPLKQASQVMVYPDADQAGMKYAAQVAAWCSVNEVPVTILDVEALGWTGGQDAADFPDLRQADFESHLVSFESWRERHQGDVDAAVLQLAAALDPLNYDRKKEDLAELLGVGKRAIDKGVKKYRTTERVEVEEEEEPEPEPTEEELAALCQPIIDDPLGSLDHAMKEAGVVGEQATTRFTYLMVTSAHFTKPTSGIIRGVSGGGKSTAATSAVKLFPESMVHEQSSFSAKALIYMSPESLPHTTIFLHEAETLVSYGDEKNDPAEMIRVLLSEGRFKHRVTEVNPVTGEKSSIPYLIEGPINLLTTTVRERVEEQLDNRCVSLHIDETREHANAVIRHCGEVAGGLQVGVKDLESWHAFARWVRHGPRAAVVPFGPRVASSMLGGETRLARDMNNLMALTRASALVNRAHREVDDLGRLIATVEDYRVAFDILAPHINTKLGMIPDEVRRVFNGLKEVIDSEGTRAPTGDVPLRQKHIQIPERVLADKLKIPKTVLRRRINACVTLELIGKSVPKARTQPAAYWVIDGAELIVNNEDRLLDPDNLGVIGE